MDVVESVRLMSQQEDRVIQCWRRFLQEVRTQILPAHDGTLVKSLGDGMLLTFGPVRQAIECVGALHASLLALSQNHEGLEPLRLRVGLHHADVVVDDLDIFGSAVNLTARLASLADPYGCVASAEVVEAIVPGLDAEVEDLGDCYLKHLQSPIRAYRLSPPRKSTDSGAWLLDQVEERRQPEDLPRLRLAVLTLEGANVAWPLRSLVADELAVQLAAHHSLDMISRMSTRNVGGVDASALALRIGADYVVGGTCVLSNTCVALTLELVFTRDARSVWSAAVSTSVDALVRAPAELLQQSADAILQAIEVHQTGRARSLPLPSLESYSMLMGGVRLMHRLSRTDFLRAREILEALMSRHPRHPSAYAWLAKWYILELHQGWSSDAKAASGLARDMARRALDHDDRCSVAMVVSGMVKVFTDRRLDEAEALYASTLDTHPNESLAWLLKGMVHAFKGEGQQAVMHARRASELSPLDPIRYYFDSLGASAEAAAGNYEQAVQLAQRSLRANAQHASTLRILTIAYAMLDRLPEARAVVYRLQAQEPDFTVGRFLERSPAADYPIGQTFAEALLRAGVPR